MRLIDADAMNEELFYKQLGGKDTLITAECAFNMINEQPTVEAKPVVYGKWIDTQPDYHPVCGNNAHVCSICGDYYTTEPEDLFFCPRCGADMRKKVQDE